MSRVSMSAVTVGIVAPRAPLSVARLRACVCESEREVGAMKTSQAANASAIGGGGSTPWFSRGDMTASTASACASWASRRSASPTSCSGSSTTTRTFSPGATARQRRTTVRTARARPVMASDATRSASGASNGSNVGLAPLEGAGPTFDARD